MNTPLLIAREQALGRGRITELGSNLKEVHQHIIISKCFFLNAIAFRKSHPPETVDVLTQVKVSLPDQPVTPHAIRALRGVHEHRQVPLRVSGNEAKVTIVNGKLAGVDLQWVRVP